MGGKVNWEKLDATCGKTWTNFTGGHCSLHMCMEKGSHKCICTFCRRPK